MLRTSIVLERPRRAGARRARPWSRHHGLARLCVEPLEVRSLLNGSPPAGSLTFVEPNETLNLAQDLGTLDQPVAMLGSIGNGPAGTADVTWFISSSRTPPGST